MAVVILLNDIGCLVNNIISGVLETVQRLMEVVDIFRLFLAMLVLSNYQTCLLMRTYCLNCTSNEHIICLVVFIVLCLQ